MTMKHVSRLLPDTEGRAVSYLEQRADSRSIVILVHGLGQDGDDYADYLTAVPGQHSVAITLPGFEPDSLPGVPAVSLDDQVRTVAAFLRAIAEENYGKDLVLVGFSLGADIILRLAELNGIAGTHVPRLSLALLLDPNVNQSTMSISSLFARADPRDPLPAFKQLIALAPDRDWFRDLCRYLVKIVRKDFVQLKRLSQDVLAYWQPDGYDQIGSRLAAVSAMADRMRVVLSGDYAEHVAPMREASRGRGGGAITFELTELRHFDLIAEHVLTRELRLAGEVSVRQ
jgi:pimeloyl-ACP methyl ester carboxylesterase